MRGYHEGQRAVQRRAGDTAVAERLERGFRAELPEAVRDFLAGSGCCSPAPPTPDGRVWARSWPASRGSSTRRTTARSPSRRSRTRATRWRARSPPVRRRRACSRIEPQTRRRVRVNGTAELDAGGVRVRTEQVYGNCPKYIARRAVAEDGGRRRARAAPPSGAPR